MRVVTFAEDNPLAATWFRLIYQSFAMATPGPRGVDVLQREAAILATLQAVSESVGEPEPNGFQPRRLTAPCVVQFDASELALVSTYLARAGYQPYLSRCVLDLLACLAAAPETEGPR